MLKKSFLSKYKDWYQNCPIECNKYKSSKIKNIVPIILVMLSFLTGLKPLEVKEGWKTLMDNFILKNSGNAKIAVSYSSLSNLFDQYHRNANNPVQSNDLIKLPILLHGIDKVNANLLNDDELIEILSENLKANIQGMFGVEDIGKHFPISTIFEAVAEHNDSAASNLLVDKLGKDDFKNFLKSQNYSNIYFIDYLDDHKKDKGNGPSNFLASGDLMNFEKKTISEISETKNGRQLLDKYLLGYKVHSLGDETGIKWAEDTKLVKGSNYYIQGEKGFVLVILVSNFSDESVANKILEEAESIFFAEYNLISSN